MRTIAQTLDALKKMRNNSHGRRWFYQYLLSQGLVKENREHLPGGKYLPTELSIKMEYVIIESILPPYVEWSFDFIRYRFCGGQNRSLFPSSEMHDTYFSVSRLCSPDYMCHPYNRSEIQNLLSPYLEENTGTPIASALSSGYAKYSESMTIYSWVEEKIIPIYNAFLDTLTDINRQKAEKEFV